MRRAAEAKREAEAAARARAEAELKRGVDRRSRRGRLIIHGPEAEARASGGDRGEALTLHGPVPGDAQTKHPWESYADFSSRKGRFTYEQAMERKCAPSRATDGRRAGRWRPSTSRWRSRRALRVPGHAQTKHPDESYSDFFSGKAASLTSKPRPRRQRPRPRGGSAAAAMIVPYRARLGGESRRPSTCLGRLAPSEAHGARPPRARLRRVERAADGALERERRVSRPSPAWGPLTPRAFGWEEDYGMLVSKEEGERRRRGADGTGPAAGRRDQIPVRSRPRQRAPNDTVRDARARARATLRRVRRGSALARARLEQASSATDPPPPPARRPSARRSLGRRRPATRRTFGGSTSPSRSQVARVRARCVSARKTSERENSPPCAAAARRAPRASSPRARAEPCPLAPRESAPPDARGPRAFRVARSSRRARGRGASPRENLPPPRFRTRSLADDVARARVARADGVTPLSRAAQHGHLDVVCALLNAALVKTIANKWGQKPIDVVCKYCRSKRSSLFSAERRLPRSTQRRQRRRFDRVGATHNGSGHAHLSIDAGQAPVTAGARAVSDARALEKRRPTPFRAARSDARAVTLRQRTGRRTTTRSRTAPRRVAPPSV